jgi:hypothetical protein
VTRGGGAAKSQVCAQAPLAFSPLGKNYKKLMKWHLKSRQVAKSLITLKGVAFYNWRVALFFFLRTVFRNNYFGQRKPDFRHQ